MSIPKPVTKIITLTPISPISRADMSAKKKAPVTNKASEDLKKVLQEEKKIKNEIINSITPKEEKKEIKNETINSITPKEEKKEIRQKVENPAEIGIDDLPEATLQALDLVMDSTEECLSFLSSGKQKENKAEDGKEPILISTPFEKESLCDKYSEPEMKQKNRDVKYKSLDSYEEHLCDKFPEPESQQKNISLDFNKKYDSIYFYKEEKDSSANIILKEVESSSKLFLDIVKAHNNSPSICIASPFKFFSKTDFIAIFQKAYFGYIFDLSYATPYYYTKEGSHHIYLSSHMVEQNNRLNVVLLDLLPRKINPQLFEYNDFADYSLHRAILVSANALYL
jgi:hypothetical protein